MTLNIAEKVIEKLRVLNDDQQADVLKFIEYLERPEAKTDNCD